MLYHFYLVSSILADMSPYGGIPITLYNKAGEPVKAWGVRVDTMAELGSLWQLTNCQQIILGKSFIDETVPALKLSFVKGDE